MTSPWQNDDPLATLFLPPASGPAVPLRYRSGILTSYDVRTGENVVVIDGQAFTNLPINPGSYLGILVVNDVVSLMSTTDSRGITTYVIMGMALTPPDIRAGGAALGQLARDGMQSEIQATSGNVTSTTYVDVLSAGLTPQVVFRTMSGKAIMQWSAYLVCGTSLGFAYMSFEVREGDSKGVGAVVANLSADDTRAIMNRDNSAGGGDIQVSGHYPIKDLVPGAWYNAQGMYRTSTGTSTFINRILTVDPK